MVRAFLVRAALVSVVLPASLAPGAERRMESLTRGVVAVPRGDGSVYVGWRMLGTDPDRIAFHVYRSTGDEPPVRLTPEPITTSTNFVDGGADLTKPNAYCVRPVLDGREQEPSAPFRLAAGSSARPYFEIPLKTPAGYAPGDASAGDLDGDGDYGGSPK